MRAHSKLQNSKHETNYNQVMRGFETLQNYMLSLSDARTELLSSSVLTYMTELMKVLPTRDFEFMFLADYFMHISQIMSHA